MAIPTLASRIPITLLTGFLGAGKTTILQTLLRDPGLRNTAVIINEFGEIGLDHDLIEVGDETIVELDGGCLCCTVATDLVETLRDLHGRHVRGRIDLERVVIETTGLADPVPILASLLGDVYAGHYFRLAGVATVVDALAGLATQRAHEEARRQIAVADRLILTKLDLADDVDELHQALRQLNPTALVMEAKQGHIDALTLVEDGLYNPRTKSVDVQSWLRSEGHDHHHDHGHAHNHDHGHGYGYAPDVNRHSDDIRAFCLRHEQPIPTAVFETFLRMLQGLRGFDLLRVKGIVCISEDQEHPLVFHAVQHAIHPTVELDAWPTDDHATRIVFIVRDIAPQDIEQMLQALIGYAPILQADRERDFSSSQV